MTEAKLVLIFFCITITWCMNSAWRAWLRHQIEFRAIEQRDSEIMQFLLAQKEANEAATKRIELMMQRVSEQTNK
jgi:hypothetical protein